MGVLLSKSRSLTGGLIGTSRSHLVNPQQHLIDLHLLFWICLTKRAKDAKIVAENTPNSVILNVVNPIYIHIHYKYIYYIVILR